jgi:hypothetical protein
MSRGARRRLVFILVSVIAVVEGFFLIFSPLQMIREFDLHPVRSREEGLHVLGELLGVDVVPATRSSMWRYYPPSDYILDNFPEDGSGYLPLEGMEDVFLQDCQVINIEMLTWWDRWEGRPTTHRVQIWEVIVTDGPGALVLAEVVVDSLTAIDPQKLSVAQQDYLAGKTCHLSAVADVYNVTVSRGAPSAKPILRADSLTVRCR